MKDTSATVIVDLTPDEERIMKNFQKEARWGVMRAIKEGLTTEESFSDGDWNEAYKLYREVASEGGTSVNPLERLRSGTKAFFVCKKEGKIIGGAGIRFVGKYDINVPRLYFVASSREHQRFQPNNILYWTCIQWCKKNGYKKFDLGGWQINARGHLEGVNKFKERWGEVVYYQEEYPLLRAIGRKLIRRFGTARLIWDKIKGRKAEQNI